MKKLLRKLSVLMVFVITVTLIPVQILPEIGRAHV